MRNWTRRELLAGMAAASVASASPAPKLRVAVFSKHLQFLQGAAMAEAAAEVGFDGVDLTVRKGGHVEPARVRQDLPGLVAILREHKLDAPMITTDIVDAESPFAEDVLRTMAELGIPRYRWGGLTYSNDAPLAKQIEAFKPRVARLAALNAKYRAGAMYHTHSGIGLVGASIWDLHEILDGMDPAAVGINYDVAHATVEGGFGGWINSFRICGPYLRGIAIKDVLWVRDAKGRWEPDWKPVGEGMVRYPQFLAMVREARFDGPVQMHYEYPLGGADAGKRTLTMSRGEVLGAMKRDLDRFRGWMREAGLA